MHTRAEIRVITGEHVEQYRHIISHSFERGQGCGITPEQIEESERIGVFAGGRLQASLRIHDFQMFFGEDRRPCGGIAGVACEPAARGRGYAGALVQRSLELMRERGQYLSSLWPFSFQYYRKYGWEWVGPGTSFKVPLELIPPQGEAEYVESITENVPAALNPCYEKFAARYNGMLARDAKRWESFERIWDGRAHAVFVYRRDGEIEGYAKIKYEEKEEDAKASEFVAATHRAYLGLLGLFRRYGMTVKRMSWRGPLDDPFWSVLCHWDVETKLEPQGMSRIVDAGDALQAMKPDQEIKGSAALEIHDEKAAWNTGVWNVEAASGRVEARKDSAVPGVSMDIQALTQAYWGQPSVDALRAAGRLAVTNEKDYAFLRSLLPARNVLLLDDF